MDGIYLGLIVLLVLLAVGFAAICKRLGRIEE